MNKLLISFRTSLFLVMLGCVSIFSSCENEDDDNGTPTITEVKRSTGPVTGAAKGAGIQIVGSGLSSTQAIKFNGYEANIYTATISDKSILIVIPVETPNILDQPVSDQLEVITKNGTATFSFVILPPAPVVSNSEWPTTGTNLTITGRNFFYITNISFPSASGDIAVTAFDSSNDGTTLRVAIPVAFDQSYGTITINALAGSTTLIPPPPPLEITELKYGPTVNTAWTAPKLESGLAIGNFVYIDRVADNSAKLGESCPAEYLGLQYIRTAVDSRAYVGVEECLSFKVSREATIYVMWNQGGATAPPAWLLADGWVSVDPVRPSTGYADGNKNCVVCFEGTSVSTYWPFKKTFPANATVKMYRNGENANGGGINTGRGPYWVVVK
jgi:hypothetical protein